MVTLQIISKIIESSNMDIVNNNQLTADMFIDYQDEFNFIVEHFNEYGNVPDKLTFLSKFTDIELVQCEESDEYLVDTLREEYLYYKSVPVIQKSAELLKTDSNAASEYLINAMKELQPNYRVRCTDIIQQAEDRFNSFIDRRNNQQNWFFTTGFPELDDIMHGIQRSEELVLIFARTNQGKSWVLEKICAHIWEIGFNVGYISPEMGALSVGYRFDTLIKQFSNKDLTWSNKELDADAYKQYIEELKKHKNKFLVATPADFGNSVTVTKLKQFVIQHKIDVLAIDGVTYLEDARYKRGDTEAQKLTHLGEDLWGLTRDINIPILIVAQANRQGAIDKESEDTPEIESVRGGDGLSLNASKIISLKQSNDNVITLAIKKQRNGRVGDKLRYQWNPDIGEFIYADASTPKTTTKKKPERKEDVF